MSNENGIYRNPTDRMEALSLMISMLEPEHVNYEAERTSIWDALRTIVNNG